MARRVLDALRCSFTGISAVRFDSNSPFSYWRLQKKLSFRSLRDGARPLRRLGAFKYFLDKSDASHP